MKPEDKNSMNGQNPEGTKNENDKAKKPNIFKRAWRGVKAGCRKVRESPAATLIGVGIGAAVAGAGLAIGQMISSRAVPEMEDEPIEQEFEETEDEVMDEPESEEEIPE